MAAVYCLTGYPGAGKSAAAEAISGLGVETISMGSIVRDNATEELGDDATANEISAWADRQREDDEAAFAHLTVDEVTPREDDLAIDGVRSPVELEVFEDEFESVKLIEIHAPKDIRKQRILDRQRKGEDAATLEERDRREEEWGLDELIAQRDLRIDNTGDKDELRSRLRDALQLDSDE